MACKYATAKKKTINKLDLEMFPDDMLMKHAKGEIAICLAEKLLDNGCIRILFTEDPERMAVKLRGEVVAIKSSPT